MSTKATLVRWIYGSENRVEDFSLNDIPLSGDEKLAAQRELHEFFERGYLVRTKVGANGNTGLSRYRKLTSAEVKYLESDEGIKGKIENYLKKPDTITGKIVKFVYEKPESPFTISDLKDPGNPNAPLHGKNPKSVPQLTILIEEGIVKKGATRKGVGAEYRAGVGGIKVTDGSIVSI